NGHASGVAASTIDCQTTNDLDQALDGSADLTITKNYNWRAGAWTGPGKMIVNGTLTLAANPLGSFPLGRTIDNKNIVSWTGKKDISVTGGANIINENGATFHIQV